MGAMYWSLYECWWGIDLCEQKGHLSQQVYNSLVMLYLVCLIGEHWGWIIINKLAVNHAN